MKPGSVIFVPSQPTKVKTAREAVKATTQIPFSGQGRGNNIRAVISMGLWQFTLKNAASFAAEGDK